MGVLVFKFNKIAATATILSDGAAAACMDDLWPQINETATVGTRGFSLSAPWVCLLREKFAKKLL